MKNFSILAIYFMALPFIVGFMLATIASCGPDDGAPPEPHATLEFPTDESECDCTCDDDMSSDDDSSSEEE